MKKANGMYINGTLQTAFTLYLPVDAPTCSYCRGCVYDSGRRTRYCFFTDELLPAFDRCIGAQCPVEWKEVK